MNCCPKCDGTEGDFWNCSNTSGCECHTLSQGKKEKVCSCSCHAVEGIQFCMNCFHKHGKAQEKEIDKERWEKDFDELTGLEMVGSAYTYKKHVDPEAIKGFIIKTIAADRAALVRAVMGLKKDPHNDELTSRDVFCYNQALDDVLAILQSPEKK